MCPTSWVKRFLHYRFKSLLLTNSPGTIWAGLIPTVIVLATHFCIADIVLIAQCCYYNYVNRHAAYGRRPPITTTGWDENAPLLAPPHHDAPTGLPGSHHHSASMTDSEHTDTLTKMLQEDQGQDCGAWLRNTMSVVMVILVGTVGWTMAWRSGAWKPTIEGDEAAQKPLVIGAEILGYISALCYLGSVDHQMWKEIC